MGHTRLGPIPKGRKWTAVVGMFTAGASEAPTDAHAVRRVAAQAMEAAQQGLAHASDDVGLRHALLLMWRVVQAARTPEWRDHLEQLGLSVSDAHSAFEFLAEVQYAFEDHVARHGGPTQISEMAHQAMGSALSDLLLPQSASLFGTGPDELREGLRRLSTRKGFAAVGQRFFGHFLSHYLNFYLSRITASQSGSAALPQVGDLTTFNRALKAHCDQSALIVRDFTGQWFGKAHHEGTVDEKAVSRFLWVALEKLRDELREQPT